MKCPECKAWTEVRESRGREGGYFRTRECGNGHRFKTVELLVAPIKTAKAEKDNKK